MTHPPVCLVEDDAIMGESLLDRFTLEGIKTHWFRTGREALAALERHDYALVLSDIRLPDIEGETLFRTAIEKLRAVPPWIFITGYGSIDHAVSLLKLGAMDYITKPFDLDELLIKMRAVCRHCAADNGDLPMLGPSPAMRRIAATLPQLARNARTILITGESGVGKEIIAQTIHDLAQPGAPLVALNCASLSESLLETELFGHERGAFTGATRRRHGVFEQADGGTLFLDEIGDMPLSMQAKLLRVIQDKRVTRVGGEVAVPVNVRLICATHRDLRARVESGAFREDLYYRINVIHLRVPPLRERKEDVLWLARQFLRDYAAEHGVEPKQLSPEAERVLTSHRWPGNVRELKHAIERACILTPGPLIGVDFLLEDDAEAGSEGTAFEPLEAYLRHCELSYIQQALAHCDGQIAKTAGVLGISRKTLWEKLKKLGVGQGP
ncbi:sigma-54-dependent transcriptional regulator [Thiobacter aerophilum]|uniref:Sigma-54 dependent transcriptional regulator n=1 Tax=Thiobacter aerophilum TaxID=3121275 RepID=A0ABV0EB72_9BURK